MPSSSAAAEPTELPVTASRADWIRSAAADVGRRATARRSHLWPALTLLVWTVTVWARPALPDFAHLRLSNPGDSESFAFYLSWNVYALTHGMNPFSTPNMYAPGGLDLGNAISVPSVSILVAPVTAAFGGTAGYNTALLSAILFGGLAVYLLARELFGSVVGATIAGALTIVSPYFAGHALSHLNLMWVFGLPFLAYLVARRVNGRLRRRWLVVLVAATIAFTVGASTELLVTQTVFALLGLLIAVFAGTPKIRRRLIATVPWLALGATIGIALAAPVILAAVHAGIPAVVVNDPSLYSTDIANLVAPTQVTLIGDTFFAALREKWLGNAAENTGYLPVTLMLLVGAAVAARRTRTGAAIAVFATVTLACSFGPVLNIAGVHTVPLPWEITRAVPGLNLALPDRFSAFVFMALALLVAQAWAARALPRRFVLPMVLITGVLLLPNLDNMQFPADASVSAFVSDGNLERDVTPGENVLVLPPGQWGPGMRWMDELDFAFTMPTGNGGGAALPRALDDPTALALYHRDLEYDFAHTLLPYLHERDVKLVVVDRGSPEWKTIMDEVLPGGSRNEGGAWTYDVP